MKNKRSINASKFKSGVGVSLAFNSAFGRCNSNNSIELTIKNMKLIKILSRVLMITSVLAFGLGAGVAQAETVGTGGDPLELYFDMNGNGTLDINGVFNNTETGFQQIDPNTGHQALTYLLPFNIGSGIVGILNSGSPDEAISFYNIGVDGYMAYYTATAGLSYTDSGGYVPTSGFNINAGVSSFAYYSGGSPGVDNDYYGTFTPAPDGGSTLGLLGCALALLSTTVRKLRK